MEVDEDYHGRWYKFRSESRPHGFESEEFDLENVPWEDYDGLRFESDNLKQEIERLGHELKSMGYKLREQLLELREKVRVKIIEVTS